MALIWRSEMWREMTLGYTRARWKTNYENILLQFIWQSKVKWFVNKAHYHPNRSQRRTFISLFDLFSCVLVPPVIQLFLGPSRTQWKNDISFHCKIDGVPKPVVEWLKDSHSIVYTRRIFAKGDTLNITSVEHNDTGNYTCKVSNNAGSTMMVKRLIVEGNCWISVCCSSHDLSLMNFFQVF